MSARANFAATVRERLKDGHFTGFSENLLENCAPDSREERINRHSIIFLRFNLWQSNSFDNQDK